MMKFFFVRCFTAVILLLFAATARATPYQQNTSGARSNNQINKTQIKHILQSIQQQYAPDLRLGVFDISYSQVKTGIILRGEVDNPRAKNAVILAIQKNTNGKVIDRYPCAARLGTWKQHNGCCYS